MDRIFAFNMSNLGSSEGGGEQRRHNLTYTYRIILAAGWEKKCYKGLGVGDKNRSRETSQEVTELI